MTMFIILNYTDKHANIVTIETFYDLEELPAHKTKEKDPTHITSLIHNGITMPIV